MSAAPLLALLAAGAARANILASAHDFTQGWKGFTANTLCETCHTPHSPDQALPVWGWNHEVTTATFTMYTSATLDAQPLPLQPSDISLACLSCHDGTVAVDAYATRSGTVSIDSTTPAALIGTDLSDDHPISIPYPNSDPEFHAGTSLPLHDGKVECSTCHDPHAGEADGLLRTPNAASGLCRTCHVK